ncbi:MAG: pyridoxamine 5'-phosphate oxidase [Thermoleophilia bacterium]|nr:pyridoxamine 5'-phosphate oxidase [Thermoleophilia bacterium]MDH4339081.1 pyridoxamine 5'-phosphate oxidase [Thermoleophilia bacterium]MDH5280897.1 pyridoxamine 5'-phosphate oxidase [Thermoleophilia bacterium]
MDEHDLANDPIAQLQAWLAEAREAVSQAEAMTLATADSSGRPSARVVLLRGIDELGLTFFTNRTSRKGEELRENPRAAVVFHWWELGRQVRVEGAVEEVDAAESAAYWASRPRASQIAGWASPQSQPLAARDELEARVAGAEQRFHGSAVPRPTFWGGYRLVPDSIEFWAHRDNRLHDRVRFIRSGAGWRRERLSP